MWYRIELYSEDREKIIECVNKFNDIDEATNFANKLCDEQLVTIKFIIIERARFVESILIEK